MIAQYAHLHRHPTVFRAMTGLTLREFDHLLVTLVWLRRYPTHAVLGWLFGVSDSTTVRIVARPLPLLERLGHATMRWPDPGKHHRRSFDDLLAELPELSVVIDSF